MSAYAFLIPFYNHPLRINELVSKLKRYELPIIIVDDGSDEDSKRVLRELEGVMLLTRDQNGGKGAAMKDGFKFALEKGFSHLFQIDADSQHDLNAIGEFLALSKKSPQNLICGAPVYDESAPKARVYGRKITNFWIYINTLGADIKDGMCGFRIYPLKELELAISKSKSDRMEFDTEILVNAYRSGVKMEWIDIRVFYEANGVSHFKMLKDNVLIGIMHARCFFSLPKFIYRKLGGIKSDSKWWQKKERGNKFLLNLTLFLTKYTPKFLLNFMVKIVVFFYYITSKKERENIQKFRENLSEFTGDESLKNGGVFSNFYEFGIAICDKFRVWRGEIGMSELDVVNLEQIKSELINAKRGQILLTSHLGNVEICKALSTKIGGLDMVILAYSKNTQEFTEIINKISGESVRVLLVNELDVGSMLELKNIVDSGTHIAVMGDRVPISGDKFSTVSFLGKEAKFNYGPYLIAGILNVGISSLWCQRFEDKFKIELVKIADEVKLTRDRQASVESYLKAYVSELERKCVQTPSQWFNFFDFWRQ
ncbi:glycosyltransferase family 2 protein [Campylobacter sp.]|uniref:glycosyltransferase family 2 protein n=1 Tax=Campylobacter sp. TaxID=205 RepID=UPI0026F50E97|nr:glycosyltransferase [Campylobacter sp.]